MSSSCSFNCKTTCVWNRIIVFKTSLFLSGPTKTESLTHSFSHSFSNSYNTWSEILFGVPQGFVFGSLLLSCNLLSFISIFDIASYVDDNTSYCTGQNIKEVIDNLEKTSGTLLALFKNNRMKANPDKYHILVNSKDRTYPIKVGNKIITNNQCEDLLGIKTDKELNFDSMSNHCVNPKNKRIIKSDIYLNFEQRRLMMNEFITSHFSYFVVVWMIHSRKLNDRIYKLQKKP